MTALRDFMACFGLWTCLPIAAALIGGCGNGNPVEPGPSDNVGASMLPEADATILREASEAYLTACNTTSAEAAKSALISHLESAEGVASAEWTDDEQAIWLEFDDGQVAAVATVDRFGASPSYDGLDLAAKLTPATEMHRVITPQQVLPKILRSAKIGPADLPRTPGSRKVLLLSAASEEFAGTDVWLFEYVRDRLVEDHGWDAGDIDIKYNRADDEFSTLIFNDFLDLDQYGIIIICAHGWMYDAPQHAPLPPRESLYVQVTAEDPYVSAHSPFGHPDEPFVFDEEWNEGRVLCTVEIDPFKQSRRNYLYMRDDLWLEHLGALPDSVVYLCIPNSAWLTGAFIDLNVGHTIVWDGIPKSVDACLNPGFLPLFMARDDTTAIEAWDAGLIGPTTFGSANVVLKDRLLDLNKCYMPTWATVGTYAVPSGTTSVKVEMAYTNDAVPLPDTATVQDVPGVGKEFIGLYPGEEITFHATALDSAGGILDEEELTTTLNSGANAPSIHFKQYGIILDAAPSAIDADGIDAATITATLRKFTNTDLETPTGDPVPDKSVIFATTLGEMVGPNPVDSDANGVASVELIGTTDGMADLTAVAPADAVEGNTVTVRIGEPEYNVIVEADPPVVVFDAGTTVEIEITATARYCLSPGEYPPTGDPVVGKSFDWSTSWRYVELIGANPGVTDANGQMKLNLRSDKDGGGDLLAFNAEDVKGGNAYYTFKWADPEWFEATLYGEINTYPEDGAAGWAVYLVFDKLDPTPAEYTIFGWGFNDTAYYGHSFSTRGPDFPKGRETDTQWYVFVTGGGGSWDPDSGTAGLEENLEWGLSRFAGGTFMVSATYR